MFSPFILLAFIILIYLAKSTHHDALRYADPSSLKPELAFRRNMSSPYSGWKPEKEAAKAVSKQS
jgi:hypothetical protein